MNKTLSQHMHERDQAHYLQTFRRYPIVIDHAKGARVWDIEGNEYIDALAGIAVNNVGHCHPKVVQAIKEQAEKVLHISNFYLSKPQLALSEKLVQLSGLDRVFFSNSGAESVEGALKVARKCAHSRGRGGTVLSFEGSFHGRTLATIATGKASMQKGFDPIPTGFIKAEFNNIDSVKELITEDVGVIIVEPIQGEGGINVAEHSFLQELRSLCDTTGIVLIFDEIQCGIGRTGHWFAKDYFGVEPDIITLAKGLGGGVAVGAILIKQNVADAMEYGDHGTTFGGNPLATAAALATLQAVQEDDLCHRARDIGEWFRHEIDHARLPGLKQVKGVGLMIGLEFDFETKPLVLEMLHLGVLANATAGNVLRLVPPLVITKTELGKVLEVLKIAIQNHLKHA